VHLRVALAIVFLVELGAPMMVASTMVPFVILIPLRCSRRRR
jgi:hypothetical protein